MRVVTTRTAAIALSFAWLGCTGPPPTNPAVIAREPTRLYWGDTHLHTSYSADAYFKGNRTADPDTAYRWAKGLPVVHPSTGARVRIETPLDFLVVADHAEMLGVPARLMGGDPALNGTATGRQWAAMLRAGKGAEVNQSRRTALRDGNPIGDFEAESIRQAAWRDILDAAHEHYAPCSFTSFIGWEWTAAPEGRNLHRVVFTSGSREEAIGFFPYSAFDSQAPEDLWAWLAETGLRAGVDFLAIPHGSVDSGGKMFDGVDRNGQPMTGERARSRARWEPVVEVTQIAGDAETHPALSPNDRFAAFEGSRRDADGEVAEGDYVRAALKRGLAIDAQVGANPFKLGMIGSTDSHTGLASVEENNFWGVLRQPPTPATGSSELVGAWMSAAGLAAVWAEENTRTAIFAAFKRREVYATTGPRIRVRFFGGWEFKKKHAKGSEMVQIGYVFGHPMGSDLTKGPEGKSPRFLMYAVKDPKGANLERMQIVKGWVDEDGEAHEKVYDVAVARSPMVDEAGRPLMLVSDEELTRRGYKEGFGAPSMHAFWEDPGFDPKSRAFYYLRVLQVPTPRHTLYDAVANGVEPEATGQPTSIQERAYSSPIWYTP